MVATNLISHIYNPDNQPKAQLIEAFVIRKKLLERTFNEIKVEKNSFPTQHYLIEGKRGMGKTTLLLRLKYAVEDDIELNEWLIPLIFHEEMYRINSLSKFWEELARLLEDENSYFAGLFTMMEDTYGNLNDKSTYTDACYQILANTLRKADKKIVLFIDNLGDYLNRFSEIDLQAFRSILQSEKEIGIVAATSVTIEALHDYKNPFYEFFRTWRLEGLNKPDTQALLLKLGEMYKSENIKYILENYPQRIEALRRMTGGVVRTIVLLFEIFTDDREGSSFYNLEALLDRVTPLYKHRMDDLSTNQQEIMHELAMAWDGINVKELAQKTRIESKILSAQLAQLYRNGQVEKIETDTKNHLYYIDERFFNIWYLMRYGRKGDKNNVIWFTNFLEDWCSPDELADRAKKHINAMKSGTYHAKGALYMCQAIANTAIDKALQHEVLSVTKEHLEKSGNMDLAEALQTSDWSLVKEAEIAYETENFQVALDKLLSVREKEQNYYKIANCYENIGNYENAERYYFKAVDLKQFYAFNSLALIYGNHYKDYQKAEEYFIKAISNGIEYANFNLGYLYMDNLKQYKKAIDCFLLVLDDEKKSIRIFYNLIFLYRKTKQYKIANDYCFKLLEEGDSRFLHNIAHNYEDLGDFVKAEEYYLKSQKENKDYDKLCLVSLYTDQNRYDEAKRELEKAIENNNFKAYWYLASMYCDHYKEYDKAEYYYSEGTTKIKDFNLLNGYAYFLFEYKIQEKEKALRLATEAHTIKPKNKEIKHTLSCCYLWNNKFDEAFSLVNEFIYDKNTWEEKEDIVLLNLLIAKKQYNFVYEYFTGEQGVTMQTKNRFKPIWYALMHYMREEHPIEYLRMGSELKETVEEIIAKIDEMSIKYA